MELIDLAKALDTFYKIGVERKERNALIQCFGIKYADVIKENRFRPQNIVEKSIFKGTEYATEIRKGMKLAKYVSLREDLNF